MKRGLQLKRPLTLILPSGSRASAIEEVCVIGALDVRRGETVKALIVLRQEHRGRLTAREIIDWARAQMATYKIPRLVEFVDALPKSGSGKLMWRELQDRQAALDHAGQDAAAYGDGRFFQLGARA